MSTGRNIALYAITSSGVDFDKVSKANQQTFLSFTNALANDLNAFDISKPCALCGKTGHTFDGCEELKDENIKPAYIKLRVLCN